ncbi:MarR family transcriptional regulator [Tepidibacillus marianensis]|uniref:MarR family winged helix-turn-helix transcriptional regulator n=1 Tax=Tepidibacillus marianensis TaxID=3131995 RepID=UPI0030CE74BE
MTAKGDLIVELEQLFYEINQIVRSEKHKCLKDGISWSQIWVLKQLEFKKQKISDLADHMGVSVPAITGLSDKLIAQGLAERIRSEQDRRIVFLFITEKGNTLLQEIRKERQTLMKIYFAGLPDEDLEHLVLIYRKIRKNMQAK